MTKHTTQQKEKIWEEISYWGALAEAPYDENGKELDENSDEYAQEALRRAKIVDKEIDTLIATAKEEGAREERERIRTKVMDAPLLYGMPEPTVCREDVLKALIEKQT